MRYCIVMLVVLVFAGSCTSPRREELERERDNLRAENQILKTFVPSPDNIDLNLFGSFAISALDKKWNKGKFHVSHTPATTRMWLMSNWAYAQFYSYDLANVRIRKNTLIADGKVITSQWLASDPEAPIPPERIKVTFVAEEYSGIEDSDHYHRAKFKGSLQIDEVP